MSTAPVPRPRPAGPAQELSSEPSGIDPTALPFLDGVTPLRDVPRRAWVEQVMGIPVSVHVRGPGVREAGDVEEAVAALFAELHLVDRLLSPWKPGSDLCRWDRGELELADAHPDLAEALRLCDQARELTQGWFDVDHAAGGPVEQGRQHLQRDPTGLVKGWAVDRAAGHLRALADHDFMVIAGGDIVVGCDRVDTPDWRLGIEDPAAREQVLMTLPLRVGALATSGTAARGDHIVDPRTRRPVRPFASTSVIGPSLLWADVWATAAFAAGPAAPALLAAQPDLVGVFVHLDGRVQVVRPGEEVAPSTSESPSSPV